MKLFICLVTPNEKLRRHVGVGKTSVVPKASSRGPFANQQPHTTVAAWTPDPPFSSSDLEQFLLLRARDHDACVLVVDKVWEHYAQDVMNAIFTVFFEAEIAGDNPRNFLSWIFARTLRTFGTVFAKFKRGDDGKLLALPLRNFRASELTEIVRLCREVPSTFSEDVERELAGLRERVRPRRKSNYKTTYIVDDLERFFAYGHEMHARFATGEPHRPSCEVAALFRFGVRLDERRHYNVSETEGDRTKIEGDFPDCHGQVHVVRDKTHLNMFANDYF